MGSKIEPQTMSLQTEPTDWLFPKYGKPWKPYTIKLLLDNKVSGDNGQFAKGEYTEFTYEYQTVNTKKGIKNVERKPARKFNIDTPNDYKGQLGATNSNMWC